MHCTHCLRSCYISSRFKALLDLNNDRNAMVISRNMNGRELMMHGGREQIDFRALILRFSNQSLTIWGSLINDDSHSCDGIKIFPDSYRSGHAYSVWSVYSFGACFLSRMDRTLWLSSENASLIRKVSYYRYKQIKITIFK